MPVRAESDFLYSFPWGNNTFVDSEKQKWVARLLGTGSVIFAVGLVLWFTFLGGGAAGLARRQDPALLLFSGLMLGICVVGLLLAGTGLFIGMRAAFGDDSKEAQQTVEGAYIIAAFVLDERGEKVFDPSLFDPSELKHLVQVRFPNGIAKEFETAPEVYSSIGEGQRGAITYQGKWLSQFVPVRPGV